MAGSQSSLVHSRRREGERAMPRGGRRRAFTLVELLVVIGIIAVLTSILVPVVGRARRQANNVKCLANLRSLHTALMGYVSTNGRSVDYAATSQTKPKLNLRSATWEGALQPMYSNDQVLLCGEAVNPANAVLGSAFLAHGTSDPYPTPPPPAPPDKYSYGSYGINGFLYYQDPNQAANIRAGRQHVVLAPGKTQQDYWFSDLTTLDGATVPQSVFTALGGNVPPGFGSASSIPAFGDCIEIDSWPASASTTLHDPTPTAGGYTVMTGDRGGKGHMLGRYCLARHTGGVNLVFMDGHARTVPLAELWQLRWNKSFVPDVNATVP